MIFSFLRSQDAELPVVPRISDEELLELCRTIHPVRSGRFGGFSLLEKADPRLGNMMVLSLGAPVEVGRRVAQISTFHSAGAFGCFAPSQAEVLARALVCIPDIQKLVAFYEVGDSPWRTLTRDSKTIHVAQTTFYAPLERIR